MIIQNWVSLSQNRDSQFILTYSQVSTNVKYEVEVIEFLKSNNNNIILSLFLTLS